MLKRMEIWMTVAASLLITAIILIVYTKQREVEFLDHQRVMQRAMVDGAAHAISMDIVGKHAQVHLFAIEYAPLLQHLVDHPQDEEAVDEVKKRLMARFPEFFAFTITDPRARPVIEDIESLVGDICQRDLDQFASELQHDHSRIQNPVHIHPQANNYHFDVMVPLTEPQGDTRIFFVSFRPAGVARTLSTYQAPGHQLILVKADDTALIEITTDGARDQIDRPIRLSAEEQRRIHVSADVPGTDWKLVDLPGGGLQQDYIHGLWQQAGGVLLLVLLLNLIIIVLVQTMNSRPRR